MVRKTLAVAAAVLLFGCMYLQLSADCATGGNCYLANGDLFIKVATALEPPPSSTEDAFEKIFPGR